MADAQVFWPAFMAAIESQDSKLVLRVVQEYSHLLNQRFGPRQDTPLVVAVIQNRWDFAYILLDSGADPNMAAGDGRLPLYEASYLADVQLTEVLLAYGGDPSVSNGYYTPLLSAAAMGKKAVVDCLLAYDTGLAAYENECGDTALSCAYRFGHAEVCLSLLVAGAGLAMSKRRAIADIDGHKFMTGRRRCDEVFEVRETGGGGDVALTWWAGWRAKTGGAVRTHTTVVLPLMLPVWCCCSGSTTGCRSPTSCTARVRSTTRA